MARIKDPVLEVRFLCPNCRRPTGIVLAQGAPAEFVGESLDRLKEEILAHLAEDCGDDEQPESSA
jgi:hypothetical protein